MLLNNKSGGFEAPVTYDAGGRPQSIAVGEVEGDGRPDLLVGERADVLVLHDNGDGTFTEAGRFPSGNAWFPLLATDLNGDGAPDILAGDDNGTVASLLNIGAASPSPSSLAFGTVAQGEESAPQTVTVTNAGVAPMTIEGLALAGATPAAFDLDDAFLGLGAGTCTGTTLAAGASCTASVAFRPAQAGALAATLLVFTNTGAQPASVALGGTGGPAPMPTPTTPAPTPTLSLAQLGHPRLGARTITVRASCSVNCRLVLTLSVTRATAHRLHLRHTTIATLGTSLHGTKTLRVALASSLARKLARLRSLTIAVAGSATFISGTGSAHTSVALRRG